jgi:hypothetical protein
LEVAMVPITSSWVLIYCVVVSTVGIFGWL